MKKLALILALLAAGGCGSHLISITKKNRDNVSNACQIVETNKRQLSHQYKQASRIARSKNAMAYSKYKQSISSEPVSKVTARISQPLLTNSATSIPTEANQELFSNSKSKPVIHKKNEALKEIGSNAKSITRKTTIVRNSKFRFTAQVILAMALTTLFAAGLFKASENKMQKLSRWANEHPALARTTIAGGQSIATIGGLALGNYLFKEGVAIPEHALWASASVFTAGLISYPNQFASGSIPLFTFFKRKIHDMALFSTGAMMMVYAGNHYNVVSKADHAEKIIYSSAPTKIFTHQVYLVKNDMRPGITNSAQAESTRGEKIGMTILASIGFTFLLILVAAASCSLSCSGNQGLAILVALAGGALVIWGLVSVIRNIWKPKKEKIKQASTT